MVPCDQPWGLNRAPGYVLGQQHSTKWVLDNGTELGLLALLMAKSLCTVGRGWSDTCFSSLMDWIRSMRISFSRSSSSPVASSSASTPSSSGTLLLPRAVGLLFCNRKVAGQAGSSGHVQSVLVGREKVVCTASEEVSSAMDGGFSEASLWIMWGTSGWCTAG